MDKTEQTHIMVMQNDPFEHILNFMDPSSMHNVYQTCKYYNKYSQLFREKIVKYTIKNIETRLKKIFADAYDDFINMMVHTNSVISGSFIIQCILNECWKGTDIDIYVPLIGNDLSQTSSQNVKTKMDDLMFKHFKFTSYEASERYGDDIGPEIRWVRTFDVKNSPYKIQLILVNVENNIDVLSNYIKTSFDFDICKNIFCYNVANLNVTYNPIMKKEPKLVIDKLGYIVSKTAEFNIGTNLGGSITRHNKYTKRGFQFVNKFADYKLLADKTKSIVDPAHCTIFEIREMSSIKKLEHTNSKSYIIITGNYYILESGDEMTVGDGTVTLKISRANRCRPGCIVNFVSKGLEHYHYNGHHVGHDMYTDFIFVVIK